MVVDLAGCENAHFGLHEDLFVTSETEAEGVFAVEDGLCFLVDLLIEQENGAGERILAAVARVDVAGHDGVVRCCKQVAVDLKTSLDS